MLRNELELLTEEECAQIALKTISYKGYNSYIAKCNNGYSDEFNCNTYKNGVLIKSMTINQRNGIDIEERIEKYKSNPLI